MKKVFAFCATLAFLLGVSGSAKAAVITDFGILTPTETVVTSLRTISGDELPGDSSVFFVDDYTFELEVTASLTTFAIDFNPTASPAEPIADFDVMLFSGTPGDSPVELAITKTVFAFAFLIKVAVADLAPGDYFLRLTGNSVGKYIGIITVVPIPAAVILFLSALASLAGFSRIRRRRVVAERR